MADLWKELNDFSSLDKKAPCPLCGKDAIPTVMGGHFKCEEQGHVFNLDGSDIGQPCHCEPCNPEPPQEEPVSDLPPLPELEG